MSNPDSFRADCDQILAVKSGLSESARFQSFLERAWRHKMVDNPEWATEIGYPGYDDRWTDLSAAAIERRKLEPEFQLKVLTSINRSGLNEVDRLSYDLMVRSLWEEQEQNQYPNELLPINQMGGIQQDVPRLLAMSSLKTVRNGEDFLTRLERIPVLVDQVIALCSEGIRRGVMPPKVCMTEVPNQIASQVTEHLSEAAMLAALQAAPSQNGQADFSRLKAQAERAYREVAVPAFKKLHRYVAETYLPACRPGTSWAELPSGRAWYASLVRKHTSTAMTPDDIFETGQAEVARIRGKMMEVIASSGFTGDFAAFCQYLRTDDRFYFSDGEELLRTYRDISKRVDPELTRFFGKLPRLPYGVIRIPAYAEKSQTTAYYQPGSPEAGRPGYFYANTYDLKSRPKWEMEALTLHEAVPGHHLQIALSQEMEGLPEFRKHSWITAYGEGWALYSEGLGEQMGFYADPYAKFGQLTYEMWRAIRLVVDTAMHSKGWSRQQAIDFFQQNSSKPLHDIEVEIDRYIVWPGQALAYKIGELKIRELRTYAENKLAGQFDLRNFHDELLRHGCLPLDLLEARMKAWVDGKPSGN